jgi:hypothetical protein
MIDLSSHPTASFHINEVTPNHSKKLKRRPESATFFAMDDEHYKCEPSKVLDWTMLQLSRYCNDDTVIRVLYNVDPEQDLYEGELLMHDQFGPCVTCEFEWSQCISTYLDEFAMIAPQKCCVGSPENAISIGQSYKSMIEMKRDGSWIPLLMVQPCCFEITTVEDDIHLNFIKYICSLLFEPDAARPTESSGSSAG